MQNTESQRWPVLYTICPRLVYTKQEWQLRVCVKIFCTLWCKDRPKGTIANVFRKDAQVAGVGQICSSCDMLIQTIKNKWTTVCRVVWSLHCAAMLELSHSFSYTDHKWQHDAISEQFRGKLLWDKCCFILGHHRRVLQVHFNMQKRKSSGYVSLEF